MKALWLLPIIALALLVGIAVSQQLRTYPWMQQFLADYPGTSGDYVPAVDTGYPWWLRWQHFFNIIFMMFIIEGRIADPRGPSAALFERWQHPWN